MRQKAFVIVLLLLVAGSGFVWLRGAAVREVPGASQGQFIGTVRPEPRPLSEFRLSDHTGHVFGREQLQGEWTLMFFGYTSCPDICPTTMLTLRSVVSELTKSGADLPSVVLVSVDPQRDDQVKLGDYVQHFGKDFVGVRGDEDQLHALALQMGAMYEREPPDEKGNYEIAHSASIFVVDPQARGYAVFSPPHAPAAIAEKLAAIRQHYARL